MPVTARLSRRLYEQLGDDVANELVDWFNLVDNSYRQDLKDFNELNFARFDAKVEQRFAESDARVDKRFAEFEVKIDKRFAESDVKFEKRFAEFEVKIEKRFAESDVKFERRFADFEVKIEKRFSDSESRLMRWMFTFWSTNLLAFAGLALAVMRAR
jgi:hypothetical protein